MAKNYSYENGETRRQTDSTSTSDKLTYLLVGGGIGALVALLFAPKAGQELRGDIADATRKGYDKTLETAQQLKEQSGTYYQQIKEQASDVYEAAADKVKSVTQQASSVVNDEANKTLNAAQEAGNQVSDVAKQTASDITDNQKSQFHSA